MIPLDEADVILARGANAKSLLESEVFVEAMQDLERYHVTAMVSCLPGTSERETRDHHHLLLFALREIASQLAGYATAAEEVGKLLEDHLPEEHNEG